MLFQYILCFRSSFVFSPSQRWYTPVTSAVEVVAGQEVVAAVAGQEAAAVMEAAAAMEAAMAAAPVVVSVFPTII